MKIVVKNKLVVSGLRPRDKDYLAGQLKFVNPKWIENMKMGRWNRNTARVLRFYHFNGENSLVMPRGYLKHLILYCRRQNLHYTIVDKRRSLEAVNFKTGFKLRNFQRQAVDTMLKKQFGTLCAPTGSGKTVMALAIIAARCQPTMVIVHTRNLAEQWSNMLASFLSLKPNEIGFIGAGKFNLGTKVTVALIQSLYKHAKEAAVHIGHLVVDECHRIPARTFTEAVTAFDAHYMLGLTATPWRRDGLSRLIFWYLGDIHHRTATAQLVHDGHLLAKKVVFRTTDFQPYHDPVREYSRMLAELTADDLRNRMIAADIAREVLNPERKGALLVLSDRRHHCRLLASLLKYKHGIDAAVLTGDLTPTDRRKTVVEAQKGNISVLVATGQLVGEGFDCPLLETLFLTTPIRFSGRLVQYVGRVLRPGAGILQATIYDYVDIKVPPLVAAAKQRRKAYKADSVVGDDCLG